jgi:hypothetical protein
MRNLTAAAPHPRLSPPQPTTVRISFATAHSIALSVPRTILVGRSPDPQRIGLAPRTPTWSNHFRRGLIAPVTVWLPTVFKTTLQCKAAMPDFENLSVRELHRLLQSPARGERGPARTLLTSVRNGPTRLRTTDPFY